MEGERDVEKRVDPGEPGDADLGAQYVRAAGGVLVGVGVSDEGDDLDEEGGGALVELSQELLGEGEFVVRTGRVGECGDERDVGLGDGPLARGIVLFGLGAGGLEGGESHARAWAPSSPGTASRCSSQGALATSNAWTNSRISARSAFRTSTA